MPLTGVSDLGFRVWRLRVWRFRVPHTGVYDLGFRVWRFRVPLTGVYDFGFEIYGVHPCEIEEANLV